MAKNKVNSRTATMEEVNRLHDELWNILTDKDKLKLVEEQLAMEKQREDEQR